MNVKFLLIPLALLGAACSSNDNEEITAKNEENNPPRDEPVYASVADEEIAARADEFGWNLMDALMQADPQANQLVSPLSAHAALSMLANGADRSTRDEMVKALGFSEINMSDLNRYNAALAAALEAACNEKVSLAMANSIWVLDGFSVYPEFSQTLASNYGAEPFSFTLDNVQPNLNKWCADHTRGLISEFPIERPSELMLANALYAKAVWCEPFYDLSKNLPFTNADASVASAEFIANSLEVPYAATDKMQAVSLPLGANGELLVNVYLPRTGSSVAEVVSILHSQGAPEATNALVAVKMPKFTIDASSRLKDALQAMGIVSAFNADEADFSRISLQKMVLDEVAQCARFALDEKGVEAAAVTVEQVGTTGNPEDAPKPEEFTADRPFVFTLTHAQTGAVLFEGVVNKL